MSVPVSRLAAVPDLAQVVQNRALLDSLPAELLVQLRREAGYLREDLDAALARFQVRPATEPTPAEPERFLSPGEAAERFGVTKRWLLEHADTIPGARRLSKKVIRFGERALSRYLSRKAT